MGYRVRRVSGFTLIELLIVIAILAILIGMSLPAIQRARETALKLQCLNNLKQIGLAFNDYYNDWDNFPPGGYTEPPLSSANLYQRWQWNWTYHILPYIDQQPLYLEGDPLVICRTPIKTYYCPTRRGPVVYPNGARFDYAGNAGTDPTYGSNGIVTRTGYELVRIPMIPDGLSQTIAVGEKQLNLAKLGIAIDDNEPYNTCGWNDDFDAFRIAGFPDGTLLEPQPDRRSDSDYSTGRFGSSHPAGFNVVFLDGSARTIRYNVSPAVFRAACVRDDGVAYSLDD